MSKRIIGLLIFLCSATLLLSGCPKQVATSSDNGIDSSSSTSVVKPASENNNGNNGLGKSNVNEETVSSADIKEEAPGTGSETAKNQNELSLQTIHFEFDSYILSQAARDILYKNAQYLLKRYNGNVRLEGHTDERGSDEYNLALGEKRAKSAMNYLITLGVPANRMSVISYGKEKPVDPASNEEAWAKNRRVDFVAQ
ncbi:MAG: peptidoglycan-associated lipoprotein Pal [Desulfuromonadales bacterium]|nr:peptidoglycan-associated lipoprotein Pal [Desulfuromonadales bacterium]